MTTTALRTGTGLGISVPIPRYRVPSFDRGRFANGSRLASDQAVGVKLILDRCAGYENESQYCQPTGSLKLTSSVNMAVPEDDFRYEKRAGNPVTPPNATRVPLEGAARPASGRAGLTGRTRFLRSPEPLLREGRDRSESAVPRRGNRRPDVSLQQASPGACDRLPRSRSAGFRDSR